MSDLPSKDFDEVQLLEELADGSAPPLESDDSLIDELAAMDADWASHHPKLPARPGSTKLPKI